MITTTLFPRATHGLVAIEAHFRPLGRLIRITYTAAHARVVWKPFNP